MQKFNVTISNKLLTVAIVVALSTMAIFGLALVSGNKPVSASEGWNAGRIIDDSIFTNKDTMSVSQIQSFLNSKVPVCDTWGTQPSEYGGGTRRQWGEARGYYPPYTCLKDYSMSTSTVSNICGGATFTGGTKTAAQIIYDAAQACRINPQVIIVLLQKEQALVTDTWPINIQYRSATGYGCPDTAPCDSQYYGLANQILWSARMFRAIMDASPTWYTPYVVGNNYIQYNPNAACGGSNVNIQNRATQALYNYTPYQPNAAALAAPMGQTVNCGAYGNINFYRYFTSWFGSTTGYTSVEGTGNTFNVRSQANTYSSSFLRTVNRSEITAATCYQQGSPYLINGVEGNRWLKITQPVAGWVPTDTTMYQAIVTNGSVPQCTFAVTPAYRAYNPKIEKHFWTTDPSELTFVLNNLKFREGAASFYAVSNSSQYSGRPVWRLYNKAREVHFWTADPVERDFVKSKLGYQDEGYAYSVAYGDNGTKPVWRLYNKAREIHFWTSDPAERDFVINTLKFSMEGEAFRIPQ